MADFSKTAFVFPGQGSQSVGMGKDIVEAYPIARQTYDQADNILGFKLSKIMLDGPENELTDTAIAQPALYVNSIALLRALYGDLPGHMPAAVAGHSLGEFSALTASGALSFEDGLKLVQQRGQLMKEAGEQNPGGMAAILALDTETVGAIVKEATQKTGKPVVIANDNCPGQVVISGDNEALAVAIELAKERKARRAIPLAVSVATHSPLMQPAKDEFVKLVQATEFTEPEIPVYANVSAEAISSVAQIRKELEEQLTSTVHWTQSIQAMINAGIEQFVEIGSGNVLTGLLRRIDKSKTGVTISNVEMLQAFVQSYA